MFRYLSSQTKRLGQRYLTPYLLSFGALVGCGKEEVSLLPVTTTARAALEEQYRRDLADAQKAFNDAIIDGVFTVEEQIKVFEFYEKNKGVRQQGRLRLPAEDRNLYSMINENLNGIDFGTPNLERYLLEGRRPKC